MGLTKNGCYLQLLNFLLFTSTTSAASCRPFQQIYPAPLNVTSEVITSASQQLDATFTALLANETIQAITNTTSFSIDVFSLNEVESLLTYHHSAPSLADSTEGVTEVDSDSIYRIGSISKAWTIYIWLLAAGDDAFNDPITDYVPELAEYASSHSATDDSLNIVDWSSITVGALASQLSGIARDPTAGSQGDDLYQQLLGLPPPTHDIPNSSFCGLSSSAIKFYCNRSDFFANNLFRAPNSPAFSTPIYTNIAFQILAYALESMTNTSFPDLFQTLLVERHSLKSTYFTVPPDSNNSVIPINANTSLYNVDFRDSSPFGGYYSTINDMRIVTNAILNSTFLPAAITQHWLKPLSFAPPNPLLSTNGIVQAVGAPWEIIRAPSTSSPLLAQLSSSSSSPTSQNVTAAQSYQTYVYTKSGDVGLYSSLTAIIPDLSVGFSILTAGPSSSILTISLADLITESFIPALFEASRQNAAATYAGRFTDTSTNSSATITIPGPEDLDQGVVLSELVYNSEDLIALIGQALYGLPADLALEIRLYPDSLISISDTGNGETQRVEGWKATFNSPQEVSAWAGAFSSACWQWAGIGGLNYGGVAFDDLHMRIANGQVVGIEIPVFQANMTRAE